MKIFTACSFKFEIAFMMWARASIIMGLLVQFSSTQSHTMEFSFTLPPIEEKNVDAFAENKTASEAAIHLAQENNLASRSDPIPRKFTHSYSRIVRNTTKLKKYGAKDKDKTVIIRHHNGRSYDQNAQAFFDEQQKSDDTRAVISDYLERVGMARSERDKSFFSKIMKFYDYSSFNWRTKYGYVETAYVSFVEGAKGITLYDYLTSTDKFDLPSIFFDIGMQLGNTYRLYYLDGLRLVHPDPNAGNFMFDAIGRRLYWIDHSGIAKQLRLENHFFKDQELNISLFARDMPRLAQNYVKNDDIIHAVEIIRAHQALFHGYKTAVKAFSESAIDIDLVFRKNHQATQPLDYLSYSGFAEIIEEIEIAYFYNYLAPIDLFKGYSSVGGRFDRYSHQRLKG